MSTDTTVANITLLRRRKPREWVEDLRALNGLLPSQPVPVEYGIVWGTIASDNNEFLRYVNAMSKSHRGDLDVALSWPAPQGLRQDGKQAWLVLVSAADAEIFTTRMGLAKTFIRGLGPVSMYNLVPFGTDVSAGNRHL